MESFYKTCALFFDFILLSLIFYICVGFSFGLLMFVAYGIGITAIIQVNYLGSHSQTLIRCFTILKNNIFESIIHTIVHFFLLIGIINILGSMDALFPKLVILIFFIGFELLFWFILYTRKFQFIGYYILTFTLMFKFIYTQIFIAIIVVGLSIAAYHYLWVLLFFPFAYTYLYVVFFAFKIEKMEALNEVVMEVQ